MKLTASTVEKMGGGDRRMEIPDDLCTGLYLVVQTTGRKGWQVRYRHGGVHRRMTLGAFPTLSLAAARVRAREVMAAAGEGRDPAEEVRAAKAPKVADDRDLVRSLVKDFHKRHLSTLRTGDAVKRELDRHVFRAWGDRLEGSITRRDVIELLDGIADSGRVVSANRVRAYLGKFFAWCIQRDILPLSPVAGVKPIAHETSRDRVLSDAEVRWPWQSCNAEGYPWGPMAQILLLTAQRLSEVARMTDGEIDGALWRLSAARTKNGRAHAVPLSDAARAVLGVAPRIKGAAGYVFTTSGESPVSGFHKAREHLARRMAEIAAKERGEAVSIDHWTFHDLRRTAATGMARMGIAVRVTEAVLNHVSGTGGGIVAVYQRHDFADEMRAALDAWARMVQQLVESRSGKVVSLGVRV